jgi:hypothetical protein
MEKPSLQSRFTLLRSKFFPAKFPFSKDKRKIWREKIILQKSEFYFAKDRGPSIFNQKNTEDSNAITYLTYNVLSCR